MNLKKRVQSLGTLNLRYLSECAGSFSSLWISFIQIIFRDPTGHLCKFDVFSLAGLRFLISAAYDWCQAKLGSEPEWKWVDLHLGWRWHLPLGPHSVSSGLLAGAPAVQVCHSALNGRTCGPTWRPKNDSKSFMTLRNGCLGYLFDVFLWGYDRKAVLFLDDQCPQSLWLAQSLLHMQPVDHRSAFFLPCGWKVMTSSNSFPLKIHYASGKIGFRFAAGFPFWRGINILHGQISRVGFENFRLAGALTLAVSMRALDCCVESVDWSILEGVDRGSCLVRISRP